MINNDYSKGLNNLACAQVLYGMSIQDQDMMMQGLGALERALALSPATVMYWRNAAILLALVGEEEQAAGSWDRAQQIEPGEWPSECIWEFNLR